MAGFRRYIKDHKSGALFTGLLMLSFIMLFFTSENAAIRPEDIGHTVVSVTQQGAASVGGLFSRTITAIGELQRLKTEHRIALEKLQQYENLEVTFRELQQENSQLKNLLGFSSTIQYSHIPAEVIGKDPENFFTTISIGKGSIDGIKPGMPVVAFQDGMQGLVGKVVQTGLSTSLVMPIYDRSCFVATRLLSSRYEGLLNGTGTPDSISMKYVKKIAKNEIKYDDLVITSGMNSLYPRGIYIGKIKGIRAKDYDTSLELSVEPVVDFSRLEYVFVLKTET